MNREITIKILPKQLKFITSGKLKILIRKARPKTETPFKCYIRTVEPKIIGEFICDDIDDIIPDYEYGYLDYLALPDTCMTAEEMQEYGNGNILSGWHISDLVIYSKERAIKNGKRNRLLRRYKQD